MTVMTTRQTLFKSKGRIFYSFFSQKEKDLVIIAGFFLIRVRNSATLGSYHGAPQTGSLGTNMVHNNNPLVRGQK
jgi:hypothetical protein